MIRKTRLGLLLRYARAFDATQRNYAYSRGPLHVPMIFPPQMRSVAPRSQAQGFQLAAHLRLQSPNFSLLFPCRNSSDHLELHTFCAVLDDGETVRIVVFYAQSDTALRGLFQRI